MGLCLKTMWALFRRREMNEARLSKFRWMRRERGLNRDTIAKKLNVSKAYLSMIETGKRSLDYKMAISMANIFDVKPDDIFFDDIIG